MNLLTSSQINNVKKILGDNYSHLVVRMKEEEFIKNSYWNFAYLEIFKLNNRYADIFINNKFVDQFESSDSLDIRCKYVLSNATFNKYLENFYYFKDRWQSVGDIHLKEWGISRNVFTIEDMRSMAELEIE